ncbi:MAG: hypothetical protein AUI92_00880 [Thaumarchaeota archaeon 13_1_40CM_3_38_6]|nr:MAG: hypothetical protein AUI92_00880 [Thaumarchaeota archaeon 13_1_40CM_3_38_6]
MHIAIIFEKSNKSLDKTFLAISSIITVYLIASLSIAQYVNAQMLPISVGPQPPTGLTANLVTPSEIGLSWATPSDPTNPLLIGYKIERSTDGGNNWSTIVENTGNTSTSYADAGLASGTTYTYRVSTINPIGTSSPSNTASATTSNILILAAFQTCCYGFLQIRGNVANPVSGIDQVRLQVYAPNGNLVLNKTEPTFFQDGYGISRSEGKGNYAIVITYDNELVAKTEVGSWINNNSISLSAGKGVDGSVSIGGRAFTGIAGEKDSVAILDPNNSQTATYTIETGLQGQLRLVIYITQEACVVNTGDPSICTGPYASEAFPTSGNYTIVLTYPTGDIAGKTMLTYTR